MDPENLPRVVPTAEELAVDKTIRDALPGEENRRERIALLRVSHASRSAGIGLKIVGEGLAELVADLSGGEDTANFRWWFGVGLDSAINGLEIAIMELKKSRLVLQDRAR